MRTRYPAVVVAMSFAASCAGGTPTPNRDDRDAAPGPIADAQIRPAGEFPLRVSGDGASLVSDNGSPFYLHGEAAWALIAQLTIAQAQQYLADREARGINAILVSLIEHKFADRAPANAAGQAPFTTPNDFTTPNEAYFAHADRVIDLAAARGIAVMLFPAYLGINGGDEGWFAAMSAMAPAKCRRYGDFVGKRYATRTNIIWMWGGDHTPPLGSAGELCMKAIADGIRAAAPTALASAHWKPESTSRDEPMFASMIDLVGVYTYAVSLPYCRATRALAPKRPTFLIETTYENERGVPVTEIRAQQWRGMIGCGAGEIAGNNPIWRFGSGWAAQLDSPLSKAHVRLQEIATTVRANELVYDAALVTAGRGTGAAEVASARTSDGTQAIVYVPPTGAGSITLDLARLTAAMTAQWADPTSNATAAAGTGLTGLHTFAVPGDNAGGARDWVLMLRATDGS